MARWKPNAEQRLLAAAMALFQEHGYDRTTVEAIASRAGLTERTFFRYFKDKREVLFAGSGRLEALITDAIGAAPAAMAPLDAFVAALQAAAPALEERRAFARQRHAILMAHPQLRERELIKLATLAAAVAACFRERGVAERPAGLIAETGIAIFKSAFERWIDDSADQDLSHHILATVSDFRQVTVGSDSDMTSSKPRRRK